MTETSASYQIKGWIADIVGDARAGDRVMDYLFNPDEQPTEKSIRNRLREAIELETLDQVRGIGPSHSQRLRSALSLGRILHLEMPEKGDIVNDPSVAARAFSEIAWKTEEHFIVLALDIKHRIIATKIISVGSTTETIAHPAIIFRWLIQAGASRCIVGHNHPSGSVDPSRDDIQLSKQLIEAGKLVGIAVMDHLVVSQGDFCSIRDRHTEIWAE